MPFGSEGGLLDFFPAFWAFEVFSPTGTLPGVVTAGDFIELFLLSVPPGVLTSAFRTSEPAFSVPSRRTDIRPLVSRRTRFAVAADRRADADFSIARRARIWTRFIWIGWIRFIWIKEYDPP
jgi:hypothetical protein